MKLFEYRESFLKFYRNLGLKENGSGHRKYENGISRKIQNWKQKRFGSLPTVSGNYRFIQYFTVGNKFGIFQKNIKSKLIFINSSYLRNYETNFIIFLKLRSS
jgi:hypothetical protein